MSLNGLLRQGFAQARLFFDQLLHILSRLCQRRMTRKLAVLHIRKINLCCGAQRVPGYLGIDVIRGCDLKWNLSRYDLPFPDASLEVIVCMSAVNYFTHSRAEELVREMFRALRPGGVCRMGVQDMQALAERYLRNDTEFFFQKLPDGRERFEGATIGDKFAAWFYGYSVASNRCQYFYDFDSLAHLFMRAGFSVVERKAYRESRLSEIDLLDNRPEQMFFLEAVK